MATLSLNSEDLQGLSTAIVEDFKGSLATVKSDIDPYIKVIPVKQNVVQVPFEMTFQSTLPKWLSQKEVVKLGAQLATVTTNKYGVVFRIPREAFDDDQLGLYRSALSDFGTLAAKHKASEVAAALKGGKSDTGFDGLATFHTAHDVGDGSTQSNLFQGDEFELSAEALQLVYTAASKYHGASGNNLGQVFDTVLVGPSDRFKIAEILNADTLPGGGTNIMKGTLKYAVLNELTETGVYYMFNSAARPLVYLERDAPEITPKFDPGDPRALMFDEYETHIRARGAAILGVWPSIARIEGF